MTTIDKYFSGTGFAFTAATVEFEIEKIETILALDLSTLPIDRAELVDRRDDLRDALAIFNS